MRRGTLLQGGVLLVFVAHAAAAMAPESSEEPDAVEMLTDEGTGTTEPARAQ